MFPEVPEGPSGPDKPDKPPKPPKHEYTELELVLYEVYTIRRSGSGVVGVGSQSVQSPNVNRGEIGVQFVKGVRYKFKPADALVMLQTEDMGRPIWKVHGKPPTPEPQ